MLFSVMLEFVDLGNQQQVESSIAAIERVISGDLVVESTSAMPITRDLSSGKRHTLRLWMYLVGNDYDVPTLTVDSVPAH
jgi:hypothetical protein